MDDERITILEREVANIKIDITSIKANCAKAEECADIRTHLAVIDTRLERIEGDIEQLKRDVEWLKKELARLRADVDRIQVTLEHMQVTMGGFVTKTELYQLESRLKSWMLTSFLALVGLQGAMFGYLITR